MFTSFRRHYLDEFLSKTKFFGRVLDIGGKKDGKKGRFRPPLETCESWQYVNIDPATSPDFLASADSLPTEDSKFDCVLLAETLEHLEFPEKALAEAWRVLKPGSYLYLTVPFLFPVHADPHDFQRWTPEKFRRVLGNLGFKEITVEPMGGLISVLMDNFEAFCQAHYLGQRPLPLIFRLSRKILRSWFIQPMLAWDARLPFQETVTGGYFVKAVKA